MPVVIYSGDIIKTLCVDIEPPKTKYYLCLSREKRLFFLINSQNREMYQCTPILKENHQFLKQDSYISCNVPFTLTENELTKIGSILSSLNDNEVNALILHVEQNVKTLSKRLKKEICESLRVALEVTA